MCPQVDNGEDDQHDFKPGLIGVINLLSAISCYNFHIKKINKRT